MRKAANWKSAIIFSDGAVVLWVKNRINMPIEMLVKNATYCAGSVISRAISNEKSKLWIFQNG